MSDNVQIEFGPEVSRVLRVFKGLSDATKAGIVAGATRGLLLAETRVRTRSGVKFSGEIRPAAGGGRILFFEDGEGNLLHFVERPADSTLGR